MDFFRKKLLEVEGEMLTNAGEDADEVEKKLQAVEQEGGGSSGLSLAGASSLVGGAGALVGGPRVPGAVTAKSRAAGAAFAGPGPPGALAVSTRLRAAHGGL